MRPRKDIEKDSESIHSDKSVQQLILEVALDIRELLDLNNIMEDIFEGDGH